MAGEKCGESCNGGCQVETNIKTQRREKKLGALGLNEFLPPIPKEVKDVASELGNVFSRYPMIPMYGTRVESGHAFAVWFARLRQESQTASSCVNAIKEMAFGGKIDIVSVEHDGFFFDSVKEVEDSDKIEYAQALKDYFDLTANDLNSISQLAYMNYEDWGNFYIELAVTEINGEKRVKVFFHNAENCLYWINNVEPTIAISPYFNSSYLMKNPPTFIPVYPNWKEEENTKRTIFHFKSNCANRKFYGQPYMLPFYTQMYQEKQLDGFKIEETENGFTGKHILEVTADSEADVKGVRKHFDEVYSRNGKGKKVVLLWKMQGSESYKYTNVPTSTNEKYLKYQDATLKDKIVRGYNWSDQLLGGTGVSGSLGGDQFKELISLKNDTVIKPIQNKINSALNKVLKVAFGELEMENLQRLSIQHRNPILDRLKEEREIEKEVGDEV